MSDLDARARDEGRTARWHSPLTWSALIVAGWTLYELTTQPALAAVVICLKFGWEDFRTAFWLRRSDPYQARAKACFALYVASGLWKTAITATIMFFAIAVATAITERAGPRPQPGKVDVPLTFIGSLVTALIGYVLLAVATCRALWLSLRHGIKLWLNSAVHRARRQGLWPPNEACKGSSNKAQRVLLTALLVLGIPALMIAIVNMVILADALGVKQANREDRLVMFVTTGMLAAVFGSGVVFLGLRDFLSRRIAAAIPCECWGDGKPLEVDWQDKYFDSMEY